MEAVVKVGASVANTTLDALNDMDKVGGAASTVSETVALALRKFPSAACVAVIVVDPVPTMVIVDPEMVATLLSLLT